VGLDLWLGHLDNDWSDATPDQRRTRSPGEDISAPQSFFFFEFFPKKVSRGKLFKFFYYWELVSI
jgi:hypothetical protein